MSDDEAYEQLTQDMQAMCRDLSAHAETIPHTQESIDALRELVDRVLEFSTRIPIPTSDSTRRTHLGSPSYRRGTASPERTSPRRHGTEDGTLTATTTCASTETATGRA